MNTKVIFYICKKKKKIIQKILRHGFADRCDNHQPLFENYAKQGFRVISFDLPSHGENSGIGNEINLFHFERLASLTEVVSKHTYIKNVPFILSGWSTGGLIATRIVQSFGFHRKIDGIILSTPAVAVPLLVGENGKVTVKTLTSNPNPPYRGPLKPVSPALHPIFAGFLFANSKIAYSKLLPKIPTLIILAGDSLDKYVKTPELKIWIQNQRNNGNLKIQGIQCKNSLHDTDNEREVISNEVRFITSKFAISILNQSNFDSIQLQECSSI